MNLNRECIRCDKPFQPALTEDENGNFLEDKRPVASRVCCHTSYCVDCFNESAAVFPDKEWFRCSVCWKDHAMHRSDIWVNEVFCVLITTDWNGRIPDQLGEPIRIPGEEEEGMLVAAERTSSVEDIQPIEDNDMPPDEEETEPTGTEMLMPSEEIEASFDDSELQASSSMEVVSDTGSGKEEESEEDEETNTKLYESSYHRRSEEQYTMLSAEDFDSPQGIKAMVMDSHNKAMAMESDDEHYVPFNIFHESPPTGRRTVKTPARFREDYESELRTPATSSGASRKRMGVKPSSASSSGSRTVTPSSSSPKKKTKKAGPRKKDSSKIFGKKKRKKTKVSRVARDNITNPMAPQVFPIKGRGKRHLNFTWEQRLQHLRDYKQEHGHIDIPTVRRDPYYTLGVWLSAQRSLHKQNRMKPGRVEDLREIGCHGFGASVAGSDSSSESGEDESAARFGSDYVVEGTGQH